MTKVSVLLAATALCGIMAPAAQAATKHGHHAAVKHAAKAAPAPSHDPELMEEMAKLRAQVAALQERLDAEHAAQATTQVQVAQTQQ